MVLFYSKLWCCDVWCENDHGEVIAGSADGSLWVWKIDDVLKSLEPLPPPPAHKPKKKSRPTSDDVSRESLAQEKAPEPAPSTTTIVPEITDEVIDEVTDEVKSKEPISETQIKDRGDSVAKKIGDPEKIVEIKTESSTVSAKRSNKETLVAMSVSEVAEWLRSIGAAEYVAIFVKNDIRGTALTSLNEDDLVSIGIAKLGIRRLILSSISVVDHPLLGNMTVSDVVNWLHSIKIGDYDACFVEHGICGVALQSLTNSDLEIIGVSKLGPRKEILNGIGALLRTTEETSAGIKEPWCHPTIPSELFQTCGSTTKSVCALHEHRQQLHHTISSERSLILFAKYIFLNSPLYRTRISVQ